MSDHVVTLVDIDVDPAGAPAQAARMLAWLQGAGIVGEGVRVGDIYARWLASIGAPRDPDLVGDDALAYRPGPAFRIACADDMPLELLNNWLRIDIGRRVYTAGENGLGIFCPSCGVEQTKLGQAWSQTIGAWAAGMPDHLACGACDFGGSLRQWTFDPPWGFGELGFSFNNWTLEPAFVEAFAQRLGNGMTVVHAHL